MLDYEVESAKRYRRYVSLAFVHIEAANRKLQREPCAGTLRHEDFRSTDRLYAAGDQTLAVLMGETDGPGAMCALQRLQRLYDGAFVMQYSVASYPADGRSPRELITAAGRGLRDAERVGVPN